MQIGVTLTYSEIFRYAVPTRQTAWTNCHELKESFSFHQFSLWNKKNSVNEKAAGCWFIKKKTRWSWRKHRSFIAAPVRLTLLQNWWKREKIQSQTPGPGWGVRKVAGMQSEGSRKARTHPRKGIEEEKRCYKCFYSSVNLLPVLFWRRLTRNSTDTHLEATSTSSLFQLFPYLFASVALLVHVPAIPEEFHIQNTTLLANVLWLNRIDTRPILNPIETK